MFTTFNLHIIYLTLPYILQTHSSQNTRTYSSYIFKLHISQSIHIQDPCPTKYLHIILIHITNTIYHNIYIYIYICMYVFLTISTHLKTYQTLFHELIAKSPFSWKIYIYNAKSPSYERQNTKSHSHGRQHHSYLTKN